MKKYFNNLEYLKESVIEETENEIIYDFNIKAIPNSVISHSLYLNTNKKIYKNEKFKIIMELYLSYEIVPSASSSIVFPNKNNIIINCMYNGDFFHFAKIKIYIKLLNEKENSVNQYLLDNTIINFVEYYDSKDFLIHFHNEKIITYRNVPEGIFEGMRTSKNAYEYYRMYIKDEFVLKNVDTSLMDSDAEFEELRNFRDCYVGKYYISKNINLIDDEIKERYGVKRIEF